MALIDCPDCGRRVSPRAPSCPHCGAPLKNGPCGCEKEEGDPRLAVLKNLKVPRGSN